jgi:hypothetical protein
MLRHVLVFRIRRDSAESPDERSPAATEIVAVASAMNVAVSELSLIAPSEVRGLARDLASYLMKHANEASESESADKYRELRNRLLDAIRADLGESV